MGNILYYNKIKKVPLIGMAMVMFMSGCATVTTTTTARNMTRPVMVGPVHYVTSNKNTPLYKKEDFDIMVEKSVVTTGGQYQTTYVTRESSEKIDAELMRKLEAPKDKVVVDDLYLKSSRACFLGVLCNARIDYSGIEGGIYSTTPVKAGGAK